MLLMRKIPIAILLLISTALASSPAKAADFTENDLTAPITDVNNYTNVIVENNRALSSGAVLGAFVYFGGTIDGNVDFNNSGSITSSHNNYGVLYMPNVGNTSTLSDIDIVNTGSLISSGAFANTIYILGAMDGATRRSFAFSLDNTDTINSAARAVFAINGSNGSSLIDNAGTISSSTSPVITLSGGSTAVINNTGDIQVGSASDIAINVNATNSTITNSGAGSITGRINASGDATTTLTVTNNSSSGITGNISTTSANLDVINTSGTITGNITLGDHESSSVALNGGTIDGNIVMNDADQMLTFGGGVLNGTVDGAGRIQVNSNTVTNGNIGAGTSLTGISIANSRTFDAATNNNSVRATAITLGSGSVLSMGNGALTGAVDGASGNQGTVNMTFGVNSNVNATLGSVNGLAAVNFTADSNAVITANTSINATNVTISGIDGALILAPSVGITGNTFIDDRSNLLVGDGSYVTGAISAVLDGSGSFQIESNADFVADGEIGTASNTLGNATVSDDATLTTSSAIRASTISIGSNATLTSSSDIRGAIDMTSGAVLALQDGATVFGGIDAGGIVGTGTINTSGLVDIEASIGDMGFIDAINIGSGSQLRIANNDNSNANTIAASNINITGQIDLLDATTISGDVTMLGAASKLNLSGYSHTINGNFTTASGSAIYSTIHSSSLIDNLTVADAAAINPNTRLMLTLGAVTPGASYTLISGGSGSSLNAIADSNINVDSTGTNRFGMYRFSTQVSGNTLQLNSSRVSFMDSAISGQQRSVSAALETIADEGTDSGTLTTFINTLSSANAADTPAMFDSVTPQVDNSIYEASIASLSMVADIFGGRLSNIRNHGPVIQGQESPSASFFAQAADFKTMDLNEFEKFGLGYDEVKSEEVGQNDLWIKAFGSAGSQDNKNGIAGFDAETKGIAFGVDQAVDSNGSRIGAGFAYANTDIDSNNINKQNTAKTYTAILYGSKEMAENLYVDGLASIGKNSYKTSRFIPAGGVTAHGDFSGQTYLAKINASYKKSTAENMDVVPNIGLMYAYTKTDDYRETGAGALNLDVNSDDINILQPKVGIDLNFYDLANADSRLNAQLRLGYAYNMLDDAQSTTSTFSGISTAFQTEGPEPNRHNFMTGAGINYIASDALTVGADINYEFNADYSSVGGIMNLRFSF